MTRWFCLCLTALALSGGEEFRLADPQFVPKQVTLVASPDLGMQRGIQSLAGSRASIADILKPLGAERVQAWEVVRTGSIVAIDLQAGPLRRLRAWAALYRHLENPQNLRAYEASELPRELRDGLLVRPFGVYLGQLAANDPLGDARIAFETSFRVTVTTPSGRRLTSSMERVVSNELEAKAADWLRERPLKLLRPGAVGVGNSLDLDALVVRTIAADGVSVSQRLEAMDMFERLARQLRSEGLATKERAVDAWRRAGLGAPSQQGSIRYSKMDDALKKRAVGLILAQAPNEFPDMQAVEAYLRSDPEFQCDVYVKVRTWILQPGGRGSLTSFMLN